MGHLRAELADGRGQGCLLDGIFAVVAVLIVLDGGVELGQIQRGIAFAVAELQVRPVHLHVDGVVFSVVTGERRAVRDGVVVGVGGDGLAHGSIEVVAVVVGLPTSCVGKVADGLLVELPVQEVTPPDHEGRR